MSEEQNVQVSQTVQTVQTVQTERSANHKSARLAYDTLIASTKSFCHHFEGLSESERAEFRSLGSYVKSLQKCLNTVMEANQSRPAAPRRVAKNANQSTEQVPAPTVAPVPEQSTQAPTSKPKRSRPQTSQQLARDNSPTAELAQQVQADAAAQTAQTQAEVAQPVAEQAPVQAQPKPKTKASAKKQ
jgi:hypothetical protein